ncbi:hypothetical protein [Ferrimonas pelagia]|uniref:hypothetical protein n=1 Tax=Ferrimonas pelagia TaxID=1177826 RepID=UPI0031E6F372
MQQRFSLSNDSLLSGWPVSCLILAIIGFLVGSAVLVTCINTAACESSGLSLLLHCPIASGLFVVSFANCLPATVTLLFRSVNARGEISWRDWSVMGVGALMSFFYGILLLNQLSQFLIVGLHA